MLRAKRQSTAYFYRISDGQRTSGQTLLTTRKFITIGVRHRDDGKKDVIVVADAPGVTCERKRLAVPLSAHDQEWVIRAQDSTEAHLEVRNSDGKTLDELVIVFAGDVGPSHPNLPVNSDDKAAVFAAVRGGRILDTTSQLQAVEAQGFYSPDGRCKIVLAETMYPFLASLARGGVVNILSLMRFGHPPHDRIVAEDSAVCSAVDIGGFGGFRRFHYRFDYAGGSADRHKQGRKHDFRRSRRRRKFGGGSMRSALPAQRRTTTALPNRKTTCSCPSYRASPNTRPGSATPRLNLLIPGPWLKSSALCPAAKMSVWIACSRTGATTCIWR